MKISIFTKAFANRSLEETLRLVKNIGFDGVEIWGSEPHLPADTDFKRAIEIKGMLYEQDLELCCINADIGGFSCLSDEECSKSYENLERYLNLMSVLNCELIKVDCGGPNTFIAMEYHHQKALYWMQKCADLALQYNKRIAMEMKNGSLIESVDSAKEFLDLLNRDNIGIIHNASNMYMADTDYGIKSVEAFGGKVYHVHVNDAVRVKNGDLPGTFHVRTVYGDEAFQYRILGEGDVDHVPLFKALIKHGYKGFLSCECNVEMPDCEIAKLYFAEVKKEVAVAELALMQDIYNRL